MAQSKRIVVERTQAAAAARASEIFKSVVSDSVKRRGVCGLALSGGTTPRSMYQHLARSAIIDEVPWSKVEVFFGDERDVPLDNVESNYGMVQRVLLDNAPIDLSRVHPMRADAEDIDAAAGEYERTIRQIIPVGENGVPRFDLIMLGAGGDGHTASLFPGGKALDEEEKLVVACHVPVLGRRRMTFTFPLINASENILLLVTGDDKADVVQRILEGDAVPAHNGSVGTDGRRTAALPAARIDPENGTFHVVLDAAAGKLLSKNTVSKS